MAGWRTEAGQFTLLTRHFFGRLFRNEMVDFEDQMKERLIVVLALLAVFFAWASWLLLFKYHFVPDLNRSWQEKNYIFTLMMLVFGLVTMLEWDVLFPDRRDFLNLTPLPVRLRTVFAAKLASFLLFIGCFSLAMMSVSSGLFSLYLTQWRTDTIGLGIRYVLAHVTSGFAAACAVFFTVVFVQLLLLSVLPAALYRRVATAIRFVLAAGLIFLLITFVISPEAMGRSFKDLSHVKAAEDPFMFRFPPLWFVGLYEVLLGTDDAVFVAEARTAGLCLVLALAAFLGSAVVSYRRHVLRTLETRKARPVFDRARRGWRKMLDAAVFRSSEERAVHDFFADTLRSSPSHRMTLVYYLATGGAGIMALVAGYRTSFRDLTPANGVLLVLPLLVAFTAVAALRVLVERPASAEAAWIFKLSETPLTARYASGLRKSVVVGFLVPLFLVVLIAYSLIWGPGPAAVHAGFGFLVSWLGVEAAFYRFRKVPFACTWVPGKLRLHSTAIPVLVGLQLTMMALAAVERSVLAGPAGRTIFLAVWALALLTLREGNRRFYRTGPGLLYEEEPQPALIELPSSD